MISLRVAVISKKMLFFHLFLFLKNETMYIENA